MTETDLVNEFLNRKELSHPEELLKSQLIALDASIKNNTKDRERRRWTWRITI